MIAFAALALALTVPSSTRPPAATIGSRPLAVASYCWRGHCSQPLEASAKAPVVFARGALVRVQFAFAPTTALVRVDGAPIYSLRSGTTLTWRATRSGGVTISVTARPGWITYVGRLAVK